MDDIFAELDEQVERLGGSWTAYIVRALWHHPKGLSRQNVIEAVRQDALERGHPIPATFGEVLSATFQKHNSGSNGFRGGERDNIFRFCGGKGSGMWALHRSKALAWMAANGRTCDFFLRMQGL